MLEAVKNSRLKVRILFVLAAMVVAIMAASAMSNASGSLGGSLGTKEADAATAYRAVKGTVFWSNTQQAVPYARVNLHIWYSGRWNLYKQQYTNSSGQYYFSNIPTGYY